MKVEKSEYVWQGSSWRLRVDTLRFDKDTAVEKGVVEHPGSVVLVPSRPSAQGVEILMIRQYRLALAQTILELPAGTRHWDEAWLDCAHRELREETGFRAESFTHLGDIWPAPGFSDELMKIYLAEELSPDPLPGDIDEMIEVVPTPLVELVQMAKDGRLQDAKSVIGILRTAVFFKLLS